MHISKGSISHTSRKAKPFRWRYKNKDQYFETKADALEAQRMFLKTRSVVGEHVTDSYNADLQKFAVEAFSILKEAGLDDPRFLVEAAKIRATRGTSELSLNEAIDRVINSAPFRSISKGTAEKYIQRWSRFANDLGDIQLVVIDSAHVREHLEGRELEASATEAHKTYTALNALFSKYLKGVGVELPNPLASLLKPKQDEVESKNPYRLDEIEKIENAMVEVAPPSEQIPFYIQKLAGYRCSEVTHLTFKDFGLGRIPLILKEELTIHFTAGNTKERKQRTREVTRKLHLTLILNPWFVSHYERKGDELILLPEFANTKIFKHSPRVFTERLHEWVTAAEVEWRKNSLRATYVSAAIRGRFKGDIEATKDSVGHSTASNTLRNNYLGFYSKKDSEKFFACEAEESIAHDLYWKDEPNKEDSLEES